MIYGNHIIIYCAANLQRLKFASTFETHCLNMRYLVSFKPLNINRYGRKAIENFGLPLYVDGSCRREPDFESKFPSISALCRFTKFAPHLNEGDTVVYITVKGKYNPFSYRHWRLVAILKILKRFDSHRDAAEWYTAQKIPLPSNCVVDGNPPLSLEKTTGLMPSTCCVWDSIYRKRARECGVFLVCEPQFIELHQPPVLTEKVMREIFGKVPATQNPPKVSEAEFAQLQKVTRIQSLMNS